MGPAGARSSFFYKRRASPSLLLRFPLMSLDDDIEVTRRLLSSQAEPTILVGHSYGGAVITGAATAAANVKALVYITAFGLDEGESLDSLAKQGPPSPGPTAIEADAHGFLWINRNEVPRFLCRRRHQRGSRCDGCRAKAPIPCLLYR